jgi:hypothetical protein
VFLQDGAAELVEAKKLKYALAVEIKHSQIIGLMHSDLGNVIEAT